jgi:excisionase family DNA binding protein
MHFNVTLEVNNRVKPNVASFEPIVEALKEYGAAVGLSPYSRLEVTLSVPADSLTQAATTAIALVEAQTNGRKVLAIEVMPTDEFDRRLGMQPIPELVSVTEAAEILEITRQRVLQLVEAGQLPAERVGNAVVIPRLAVEMRAAQA